MQRQHVECRQRPTESGGERGAALVGDLVAADAEEPERRQHASGWRGQQSGQALVADLVLVEEELLERQLAQSRGQGSHAVSPASPIWLRLRREAEVFERGQRPLGEGGGEGGSALVSNLCAEIDNAERRQDAAAEAIC